MSRKLNNDPLSNALTAFGTHKELIHEVYSNGRYIKNGTKTDRDAFVLHQNRIFVSDGMDSYRLSGLLTQFFDGVTQKQRLYELLGEQAGAQVRRIDNLITDYQTAYYTVRQDDMDTVVGQFHGACNDLSDTFTSGISKLLNLAETNFAVVSSVSAKTRQNSHYLRQAKLFSDALESLGRNGIELQLSSGICDFEPLEEAYQTIISNRKSEWHTEISRLLNFFESYLYKLRDIAPDVKRFRQFSNFLQQNPGYELPELGDPHHRPLWMMYAPPMVPVAHSDVNDTSARDFLYEIAAHIPAPKNTEPVVRDVGVIERSANRAPEVIKISPHHIALGKFARAASISTSPISALDWKSEYGKSLELSDEVWLLLVSYSKDITRTPYINLTYQTVERRGDSRLSRNLYVKDVLVHGS